jgi:hypothetical protein
MRQEDYAFQDGLGKDSKTLSQNKNKNRRAV